MQTCEYAGDPIADPRSHPWLDAVDDPDARYYDLTAFPALIRSSLEDLLPWSRYAAIETFYALLERINHPRSALESNDCEFTGPHANAPPSEHGAWECSGRVMILFRALTHNTRAGRVERLKNDLHGALSELDPSFKLGTIGTTLVPARYLALPEADGQQLGWQLSISFWAWGNSEADSMLSLARTLTNLGHALRKVPLS
jgi:hypothetical protein